MISATLVLPSPAGSFPDDVFTDSAAALLAPAFLQAENAALLTDLFPFGLVYEALEMTGPVRCQTC